MLRAHTHLFILEHILLNLAADTLVVWEYHEHGLVQDLVHLWHTLLAETVCMQAFKILELLFKTTFIDGVLVLLQLTDPELDVLIVHECWWDVLGPPVHDFVEEWLAALVHELVVLCIQD